MNLNIQRHAVSWSGRGTCHGLRSKSGIEREKTGATDKCMFIREMLFSPLNVA